MTSWYFPLVVPQDSVVVESPLPGGVAAVVRALFHVPQWIQIGGAVLGVVLGGITLVVVWRARRPIAAWVRSRPRASRIALAVAAGGVVVLGLVGGGTSWNYMQHDNDFCTGCHVMGGAYTRFQASRHDSLNCHDCHQQSIFASARQLYLWVAERPEEIGEHAPVANAVCETCHVTDEPELWQRVAATAGHRTHLESDSSALADVLCVTCHGREVHEFAPVDQTCGQSDCHTTGDIAIGAMAGQTALHCVTCHEFTAEVPRLAVRDSAAGTLVPSRGACFSCHEMRAALEDYDPERDPHNGACGMCHNPHDQEDADAAAVTCGTAGCHADWRTEPFHVGASHRRSAEACVTCHAPHRAEVDASDCTGCHRSVAERPDIPNAVRNRLRRALPFDTTAAMGEGAIGVAFAPGGSWRAMQHYGAGFGWPGLRLPDAVPRPMPSDSFPHDRHTDLTCLTCHTIRSGAGPLTFESPRGCQICHHRAPDDATCAQCHREPTQLASVVATVRVQTEGEAPRDRAGHFVHAEHQAVACRSCHAQPVTLGVSAAIATCQDCHADHHGEGQTCAGCHAGAAEASIHAPPNPGHAACDACHAEAAVAHLLPDNALCATCHAFATPHYEDRACTTCHMLTSPEGFRPRLRRGDGV